MGLSETMQWTCLKYSLRCLLFSKSRVEPPKMGMIIPKVGNAEGWLFVIWFSSFSGGPGGGGSCSCVG